MLKVEAGDGEFEVILGYIASLRLACDTRHFLKKGNGDGQGVVALSTHNLGN